MALNTVELPIEYYPDPTKGRPVFNGSIFVGEPDTDPEIPINQKQVTLRHEGGDTSVSQPVLTGAGGTPVFNGSPAQILVDGNYSLKVLNNQGAQVYNIPNAFNGVPLVTGDVFLGFDTLADIIADTTLSIGDIVQTSGHTSPGDNGDNIYEIVAGATGMADSGGFVDLDNGFQAKGLFPQGIITVEQWGCIPAATSTLQQIGAQECVDYIIARGQERNRIEFGAGLFNIDDEIDVFRASSTGIDIEFRGAGMSATEINSDFFGAGKALFRAIDAASTDRCAPTSFTDMEIGSVTKTGGVNPISINIVGHGEGRLNNIKFGPNNNTQCSLGSMQNIRGNDVQFRNGGHSFTYKDTDAITFTITGAAGTTATVTASSPIFTDGAAGTTDDTGLSFLTVPVSGNRIKWLVQSVTSSTIAVLECDNPTDTVGAAGFFQSAFGSMTSGSNQLSVNTNVACFVSEDVGRIVYVKEARSGTNSSKALLRARIGTFISTSAVLLVDEYGNNIDADRNVTNVEFGVPVFDMYTPRNGSSGITAGATDNKFNYVHIEDYIGIACCINNMQQFEIITSKIEGLIGLSSDEIPTSTFWCDDVRGEIDCDISTHSAINKVRVYASDQTGTLIFGNNDCRNFVGGFSDVMFKAEAMTDPDGEVIILNPVFVFAYGNIADAFEDDTALADPTDPRLLVHGPVRAGVDRFYFNGPLDPWMTQLGEIKRDILPQLDQAISIGSTAKRIQQIFTNIMSFGSSGTVTDRNGFGSPEGQVTATKGSTYRRIDGAAGTCFYVKESDTGNTGWVSK